MDRALSNLSHVLKTASFSPLWTAPSPGIREKPENLRERSSVFSIKRSPDKTDSPARPRLPPKTAAMAKSGLDDDLQDRIGF